MSACPRCGASVEAGDLFCRSCGQTQPGRPENLPLYEGRWQEASRSLSSRARVTVILLGLAAALAGILFLSTVFEIDLLGRLRDGLGTVAEAEASDRRQAAIGIFGILVMIPTVVWWLLWQQRAHANLELLGARGLRFTPGWAVGWWFVPVANLVQPFRAVRELWLASDTPAADRRRRHAPRIAAWWGLFLGARVLSGAAGALRNPERGYDQILNGSYLLLGGALLEILAAIIAISIVQDVGRLQERTYAELRAAGGPPAAEPAAEAEARRDLPPENQFRWEG